MSTLLIRPQRFVDVFFVILHPDEPDRFSKMTACGTSLRIFFDEYQTEHPHIILSSSDEVVLQEKNSFIIGFNPNFPEEFIFEDCRFDNPPFTKGTPTWKRSFKYLRHLNQVLPFFREWIVFASAAHLTKILWFCTKDLFLKITRSFPLKRSFRNGIFNRNLLPLDQTYHELLNVKGGEIVQVRFIFSLTSKLQIIYFYRLPIQ